MLNALRGDCNHSCCYTEGYSAALKGDVIHELCQSVHQGGKDTFLFHVSEHLSVFQLNKCPYRILSVIVIKESSSLVETWDVPFSGRRCVFAE